MKIDSTKAMVSIIAVVNMLIVGCSSIFAVHGDGTVGEMYGILGGGAVWVAGFAARALALADRGDPRGAVSLVSGTLLYGLVVAIAGMLLFGALSSLWQS